jgi:hypothetical protein
MAAPREERPEAPSPQAPATETLQPTVVRDRIGGAIGDITFALLAITIPMCRLTVIFGALVAHYHLPASTDGTGDSATEVDGYDGKFYYVNYSATRLITVSSWTSTAMPLISSFATLLLAYPLARKYMQSSQTLQTQGLPSPYQLGLFIGLSDGSLGSLWSWMLYCFWKKRCRQATILQLTALGIVYINLLG